MIAPDVTACVPTVAREAELRETLRTLVLGETIPGSILVSEATGATEARARVGAVLAEVARTAPVKPELLPPPRNGQRCGNRNWLGRHVQTRYALFLDDDIDVPPTFLRAALTDLQTHGARIVVAASDDVGGSGWLTLRGHFRPAHGDDPIAVGFQLALWETALFQSLWLDERIVYGSEEADLSVRLYEQHPRSVCHQSVVTFHDRGRRPQLTRAAAEHSERSRCYASIRRYRADRTTLGRFLAHELAANLARGRRPLPQGLVPHQWRGTLRLLLGGEAPEWASQPLVTSR